MNTVDIVLAIPLLYAAYKGFTKGFILEIGSLIALILGIWGALQFSFYTESLLTENTEVDKTYVPMIAFALTFFAFVIGVHFLAKLAEKIIKMAALSIFNKLLGGLFGMLKAALIISYLLILVNSINEKWQFIDSDWREESVMYEPISNIGPSILPMIEDLPWYKDYIKEYVD